MANRAVWPRFGRLANLVGVLLTLTALAIMGRFAVFFLSALRGHPPLTG
ncbi:MAG: hypothetical protein L0027_06810 [Candidatus Rokubacteria bacterium]|nr:hypothetical protein [Candidatus Rokubacteria bacterium]